MKKKPSAVSRIGNGITQLLKQTNEKAHSRVLSSKAFVYVLILLVCGHLAGCGEKYRTEGNALSKQLFDILIKNGYCKNYDECYAKEVMYGEDGDRVYLGIYGISDQKLLGEVLSFVVTEGRQITGGVPITVSVFSGKKREYVNSIKSFTAKPVIHLEIN